MDALALEQGADPGDVAAWLAGALKSPARERFLLRVVPGAAGGTVAGFVQAAEKVPGVQEVDEGKEGVLLLAKPGMLRPEALSRLAAEAKVELEILEPVPVAFRAKGETDALADARALSNVPGVWYAAEEKGVLRAWVTRLLLLPGPFESALPRYGSDFEAHRYAIPGVSLGPPGMRVATAVQDLPGVLSVFPALASETITIVGRREGASWAGVLDALQGAGVKAREKP